MAVPGNRHNAMIKVESCVRRRDAIRPLEAWAAAFKLDSGPGRRRRRIRGELSKISRRLNSSSGLPCSDSELGSGEPGEVLHLKVRSVENPFTRPGIEQFSLLTITVGLRLVLLSQTGYRS